MIYAHTISLAQGISYDNVYIAEEADLETYNIPKIFPTHERVDMVWDGAIVFWYSDKMIISHASNVRTIKIDTHKRKFPQPDNIQFIRLVLNGDIVYENGVLLNNKYHEECGIPTLFADEHDIFDQIVFTCADGVFVTHDINICTIIIEDSKRKYRANNQKLEEPNTINPLKLKQRKIFRS